MTPKQKAFIESVVSMDTPKNHPVLEAALKLYVMNEGLEDFDRFVAERRGTRVPPKAPAQAQSNPFARIGRRLGRRVGSTIGHMGRALSTDPVDNANVFSRLEKYDVSPAQAAVDQELFVQTWDIDYPKFLRACSYLEYFMNNYGIVEINQYLNSRYFKECLAIGDEIDRLRPNPVLGTKSRQDSFVEMVQKLRTADNADTVDTIVSLYEASEDCSLPITESMASLAGQSIMTLNNELAAIGNFIRAHGSTPWRLWLREHRQEMAMASRNNWQDRTEPEQLDDDDED